MNKKLDETLNRLEVYKQKLKDKLDKKREEEDLFIEKMNKKLKEVVVPAFNELSAYFIEKGYTSSVVLDTESAAIQVHLTVTSETDYFDLSFNKSDYGNHAKAFWTGQVEGIGTYSGNEIVSALSNLTESYVFNLMSKVIAGSMDNNISELVKRTPLPIRGTG